MSQRKRQLRVVDMMITAHALMRDRLARRARALNLVVLTAATGLCGLTFLDAETLRAFRLHGDVTLTIVRLLAVAVFLLSLLESRIAWAGNAALHGSAVKVLFELKSQFKASKRAPDAGPKNSGPDLDSEYVRVMKSLPEIGDRYFLRLKAIHYRKVELSKRISANPGKPLWLQRLHLFVEGLTRRGRSTYPE